MSYVPLSSASRWQRVTQEDGQGECGELPSETSVQRVCIYFLQTEVSVQEGPHWCMGYGNMIVLLLPALSRLVTLI